MTESILWMASENWLFKSNEEVGTIPASEVLNIQITASVDSLRAIEKEYLSSDIKYVVAVITEPILLLMMDPEYMDAMERVWKIVFNRKLPHSLLLDENIYRCNFGVFQKRYYNSYIHRSLYIVHRQSLYDTIKESGLLITGAVDVKFVLASYYEYLVFTLHDNKQDKLANKLLDLGGDFFTEEERDFISTYDEKLWRNRETLLDDEFSEMIEDEVTDDHRMIYSLYSIAGRDTAQIEQVFSTAKVYLERHGSGRDTVDSRNTFRLTLGEKLFQGLIDVFNLNLTDEERKDYLRRMAEIVSKWKRTDGLNVVPFKGKKDLYNYLQDYIGDGRYVVYNKYILRDRLFADEMDRFMTMFQEYVTSIRKIDIKFEKEQTERGIIYVIKSYSPELVRDNFGEMMSEFSTFIDSVDKGEAEIREIVNKYDVPEDKAKDIVHRYSRELQRMKVDIKYDYQKRYIDIMHRMETELTNGAIEIQDQKYLLEKLNSPSVVYAIDKIENLTIVDKQLNNFIEGDLNYGAEDKVILDLIQKYEAGNQELINALNVLKDAGVSKETKDKEGTKLKRFLMKTGEYAGDVGVGLLTAYLQKLMGMS